MRRIALFLSLACVSLPATSQVARQATPQDLGSDEATVNVPSPMLIDLPMGASDKRKSFADPTMSGRTFYETKRFVCDKAHIPKVTAMKKTSKDGAVTLEIAPAVKTGWYRQHVQLKVAVVSGGKEIKSETDKMTIGSDDNAANKVGCLVCGASSSKLPTVNLEFTAAEWASAFAEGKEPALRLVLTIVE